MRTNSYDKFWQKIHQKAKNKGFPVRVMFELTYRCNFFCGHCYVPLEYRKYRELKTKDVFAILEQLRDIGCFYLGFTGGEPFIREDILKILRHAKKCGLEVIIYTNGSLIDEKIADELEKLRLNKVDITVPAMSKTAFERITGVAGSYEKVFRAIDFLHKRKVTLGFKTCVLKDNKTEIEDIQELTASLGALHRLDDMLSRRLDGSEEPYQYRGFLIEKALYKNSSLEQNDCEVSTHNLNTKNRKPSTEKLFECGVGGTQAAITPWGELKMCVMIDQPKYKINSSLEDTWKKLKDFVAEIKPDNNYQCNSCQLLVFCKWCPAKAWLYNRTFTSCEPESRKKAELIRQSLHFKESRGA